MKPDFSGTLTTGMVDLSDWPAGMRLIIRKERPHPGAQLRQHVGVTHRHLVGQ